MPRPRDLATRASSKPMIELPPQQALQHQGCERPAPAACRRAAARRSVVPRCNCRLSGRCSKLSRCSVVYTSAGSVSCCETRVANATREWWSPGCAQRAVAGGLCVGAFVSACSLLTSEALGNLPPRPPCQLDVSSDASGPPAHSVNMASRQRQHAPLPPLALAVHLAGLGGAGLHVLL